MPVPLGNAGEWWRETLHVKAAVAFVAEQHALVVLPAAAQLARDVGHAHHDRLHHYIFCAASWWSQGGGSQGGRSRASGSSRCYRRVLLSLELAVARMARGSWAARVAWAAAASVKRRRQRRRSRAVYASGQQPRRVIPDIADATVAA